MVVHNRQLIVLSLFCFLASGFAVSQDKSKSAENDVFVKANLLVLDSNKKPIDDVKSADVKIFEDGVPQQMTYFRKKLPKTNLGLLVDNSGSMRLGLNSVETALVSLSDQLLENSELFLIRFISRDKITVEQDWTADKAMLVEAVKNLYIDGGQSAVIDAIYLATEKLFERERKNKEQRHAIILISDAEDRDSYYSFEEMIKPFKDSDIQVFVISFAENAPLEKKKARSLGARIALETGGTIITLPQKYKTEDVTTALRAVMIEIRSPFVFGYKSTNSKRDGIPRNITVEIADGPNGEKRFGIVRGSLVIPKK